MAKAKTPSTSISLNRYIRDSGLCSRREADQYIAQGRVTINGDIAQTGNRVLISDEVTVDGERIRSKKKPVIIVLNKPPKTVVIDDKGRGNDLISQINHRERLFAIDPLDKSSEGLVLLTNDGTLAARLNSMTQLENEYTLSLDKAIKDGIIEKFKTGVHAAGKTTTPLKVKKVGPSTIKMTLSQGQSKYIRPMCLQLGLKLKRLHRIRVAEVSIQELSPGQWRVLPTSEREELTNFIGSSTKKNKFNKEKI